MRPEDIIHRAWVQRARRESEWRKERGLAERQIMWPHWTPEVAVAALRAVGMLQDPVAETVSKLAEMSDEDFDGLYQELVRGFDETGGSE